MPPKFSVTHRPRLSVRSVTEKTANLVYSGESGGLNEAMSDM